MPARPKRHRRERAKARSGRSLCTPCAQAIEDETRQLEIAPVLLRRCLVCRTDIAHLRAGARTCGDACRNMLSRLLRRQRRAVP